MEPQEAEEGQECTRERCLDRRRELGDLQKEVDHLWNRQVVLTQAKEGLDVTVKDLGRTVKSQEAEIAELQKHEKRFNEEFFLLNEMYRACMEMLDTKKQENTNLEDERKYLLEINANHLAQIQRLEDFATRKLPETPEWEGKSPRFDIDIVEQQRPPFEHFGIFADGEDNGSMGSAYSKSVEYMDDILGDSDKGPDDMELDSYSTRSPTPSAETHERRSSIRSHNVDDTEEMPRSTAEASANPKPSHQAITDATEAKDLAGAATTQAVMPESPEIDCHQELQTRDSTYTRLSRIHVHASRSELVNTLSVIVRCDDQGLHTSTTVLVIDKSRAGCPPTKVVIDKLLADVIPSTNPGECLLLKDFKASWEGQICLKSHTNSKWCIWRSIDDYESIGQSPVFGLDESAEMERLRHWWQSQRDARGGRPPPFC